MWPMMSLAMFTLLLPNAVEGMPSPQSPSSSTSFLSSTMREDTTKDISTSSAPRHQQQQYGRISDDEYILTPEQIAAFHRDGCVTIQDVLTEEEVEELVRVFDRFVSGDIPVPGKDFCDMSKPFGIPYEEWSLVNCMLPTRYYPPLQNNVYERLTNCMAQQLFASKNMVKDYDQLLNKRPGKEDAVFAFHQDMAYWPSSKVLGVTDTSTCTFSLAMDDSDEANGCLRYVVGSGVSKELRSHRPASGNSREEGHALVTDVGEEEQVRLAPAKRGSITIHDEYVVHGSGGSTCKDRQRRTVRACDKCAECGKGWAHCFHSFPDKYFACLLCVVRGCISSRGHCEGRETHWILALS